MGEEYTEEQLEQLQIQQAQAYGYPTPPSKENLFKFFNGIIDKVDSRKVSNLKESELGVPKLTVRGYLEIADYMKSEGMIKVADYLRNKAEIINSTSSSRKGFLAQLFVTQIKRDHKIKGTEEKKGWFANKKPDEAAP